MLKVAWKGLVARKWRLLLTLISVVIGVSFVSGTYVLTDTMNRTFEVLFAEAEAGVDVEVRAKAAFVGDTGEDRPRVPESLLETVLAVDGVAIAEGGVGGFAQLVDKDGEAVSPPFAPTLGVSWPEHDVFSALSIREGNPPRADGEVVIDAASARDYGFAVGDRITILFEGPSEQFEIVGIAGFGAADNLGGATLAAFELETAQRVLGAEGEFDTIFVVAEEDVSPIELRNRVASVVPRGVEAVTAASVAQEQTEQVQEGLGFFSTFLLVFAGIALFVAAFQILNTFNILVTQRTRELALLRALGASGRQVTWSVILEALVMGIVASAAGLALGLLVAMGLKTLLEAVGIDIPSSGLQVLPRTIIVSFIVGIVVTVVASILPARRAARIPPVAALRDFEAVRPLRTRRRSLVAGMIIAGGVGLLVYGLADGGIESVGLGVAVTFIGVAALAPVIARPLAGGIGRPIRALSKTSGRLGRENAMRNPRRTAATASALMIGLALVGTFAILGASTKTSIAATIDRSFRADFILSATSQFGAFSPAAAQRLREAPEIALVSEFRFGEWREPGSESTEFLSAVDPATLDAVMAVEYVEGSTADLTGDALALESGIAESRGLEVGDTYPMEFAATGVAPVRIVGTFEENPILGEYIVPLELFETNFDEQLDSTVMLTVADGVSVEAAREAVEAVLEEFPNVELQDQAGLREEVSSAVDQLLGLVTGLLALSLIIAAGGIASTIALSVFERTRELGLLRAVGMSRSQVRAMVRWESVVIALLGGVLGLVVGLFFGWALVTALADEGISELTIPVVQLVIYLVVAGLIGVLAALVPAWRAARLDVLQAIAHE